MKRANTKKREEMKKGKSNKKGVLFLLAVVALAALLIFSGMKKPATTTEQPAIMYNHNTTIAANPLSIEGFSKIDVGVKGDDIYIVSGCKQIVAKTTPEQAYSIEQALSGNVPIRPIAHDIAVDIINATGATVSHAAINDYRDGIYYARLYIKYNGTVFGLDSRPSDGMAIALRVGAPVYMKNELIQKLGKDVC